MIVGVTDHQDPEQAFAASVARLRQERGWSQDRVAGLLRSEGIADATQITVSRVETGRRKVTLSEALAFARIFDLAIPVLADVGPRARQASHLANRRAKMQQAVTDFEEAVADYLRDGIRAAQLQAAEAEAWLLQAEGDEHVDAEVMQRMRDHLIDAKRRLRDYAPSALARRIEAAATRDDGVVIAHPSRVLEDHDGEHQAEA